MHHPLCCGMVPCLPKHRLRLSTSCSLQWLYGHEGAPTAICAATSSLGDTMRLTPAKNDPPPMPLSTPTSPAKGSTSFRHVSQGQHKSRGCSIVTCPAQTCPVIMQPGSRSAASIRKTQVYRLEIKTHAQSNKPPTACRLGLPQPSRRQWHRDKVIGRRAPATQACVLSVSGTCTWLSMWTERSSGAMSASTLYGATRLLASIWNT